MAKDTHSKSKGATMYIVVWTFPDNLVVRLSSAMIDAKPMSGFTHTSTVNDKSEPIGFACRAPAQGNKCLDCRACWDKSIANVSYHLH